MSRSVYATTELQRKNHKANLGSTLKTTITMLLLIIIAIYFLLPLFWLLIASTKSTNQLFNTPMLALPDHINLLVNLKWLNTYQDGVFWRWGFNSIIYAGVTAIISTLISAMGGYSLSKYNFRLNKMFSALILGALMVPHAALVIPIFLMVKSLGLMNTYAGVILPMLASPFGIYFMTVYLKEAMPNELIDSGRIDGATDYGIFFRISLAIMKPGLVTLFLITFIGTWNNFFLPMVLLSKTDLYPLTVGLEIWTANLNIAGSSEPVYPLIILGSFLSILPMMVLFPFLRKYIVSGISLGSVKS